MSLRNKLRVGAAVVAIAGQFAVVSASAQETAEPEVTAAERPEEAASPARLGVITVTAQKREQSLQDIPGSVSAIGGESIEALGISSVQDLASQVPGLDFGQTNGGAFITLRGVSLNVDTGVAEPNVAVHLDGAFLPRSTMGMLDYTDVERIEVLRGPQGTLYGRNATGGAINFVSKQPGDEFGGEVKLGYGSFDTISARGILTGPLTEKVGGRLSVAYDRRGEGYADNTFTGGTYDTSDLFNVRGAVAVEFSDRITGDFSIQHQEETFQTYQQLMTPLSPVAPVLFPSLATAAAPSDPWTIGNDYNPDSKRATTFARAGFDFELTPDVSLKSITAFIDHEFENRIDGDGTSAPILTIEDRVQPSQSLSQELNLSGTFGDRGNWLLGAYVFQEDFESSIPVVLPSGFPLGGLPPGTVLLSELQEETKSYAVFADATLSATDKLRFFGGVRLSRDEKEFTQTAGAVMPGVPTALTLTCENQQTKRSYDSASPRFGAQYDIASGIMGYAQYSRGYKSGGLNSSTCGNFYDPEKLEALEAGLKSSFLNGQLTLNASLFSYRYTDLQLFKIVGNNAIIENANSQNEGAEIEGRFFLGDNWQIDGAVTLLKAQFTDFESVDPSRPGLGSINLRGYDLPRSPRTTANLGIQGDFNIGLGLFSGLSVRADAKFSDGFYLRPFEQDVDLQKSYVLTNLTASLKTADGQTSVRAFVRNLTDEPIISHQFYTALTDAFYGNYLPPRTWGVEISRSF